MCCYVYLKCNSEEWFSTHSPYNLLTWSQKSGAGVSGSVLAHWHGSMWRLCHAFWSRLFISFSLANIGIAFIVEKAEDGLDISGAWKVVALLFCAVLPMHFTYLSHPRCLLLNSCRYDLVVFVFVLMVNCCCFLILRLF